MEYRVNTIRLFAVLLALGVLQSVSPARAEAPPADAPATGFSLLHLLDSSQPAVVRLAHLGRLRTMADEEGSHSARCVLGRLGFRKASGARDLPDADYGEHKRYLNACVLGGDIDAMLVLAEAELRERRSLEAMIWVQSYIKIASFFGSDVVNSASAYKAGLLQRIERASLGNRPSNEEVLEYVAGLLDAHGERIIDACESGGCGWMRGMVPDNGGLDVEFLQATRLVGRFTREMSRAEDDLVYGTFLVEIDESGRTRGVHPLEIYPDASATRRLVGLARTQSFNEVEQGAGTRYAFSAHYITNRAYQFVPDAPPRTRTRVRTY